MFSELNLTQLRARQEEGTNYTRYYNFIYNPFERREARRGQPEHLSAEERGFVGGDGGGPRPPPQPGPRGWAPATQTI